MKKTSIHWGKALLSLWLVYHLTAVVIVPNFNSLLGEMFGRFFIHYTNTLGISIPWQFFSPDPSVKVYWQYSLDYPDKEEGVIEREMELHQWPPSQSTQFFRASYYRKIYQSRMTSSTAETYHKLFIYWLCKKHPQALGINILTRFEPQPSLYETKLSRILDQSRLDRYKDLLSSVRAQSFPCRGRQQEEEG